MKKIRFSLLPNCSFRDLQLEIERRFNLDDISRTGIKYLDDDCEWVLLNCDADLEECMEIYSSSPGRTVRLCLQQVFHANLAASFGNSCSFLLGTCLGSKSVQLSSGGVVRKELC